MPLSRDNFDSNSIYRIVNNAYTTSNNIKTSIQRQIDALTSASANYLPATASANYAFFNVSTNSQFGTSYTLQASDAGRMIEMNSANANLVIIPLNTTVPFPIGTKIDVMQVGAGATSASIVSGVTLNSETGKRTVNAQWQAASLVKRASDTWVMIGAIKA